MATKKWAEKNKEKIAERTKKYREENPDIIKEQRKATRIRCADRIKAYNKTPERRKKQNIRSSINNVKYRLKCKIIDDAQKSYYCVMYEDYLTALCLTMKDHIVEVKRIKLEKQKEKYSVWARINYQENRAKYLEKYKNYYRKTLHLQVAKSKRNKAKKMQRTPEWANNNVINDFYELRQFVSEVSGVEYHVDHIVPLQGKKVSGLHVAANLQIIKAKDNLRKHARFNPDKHEHRIVNEKEVYVRVL